MNRTETTVLIYAIPDGADPEAFAPVTEQLKECAPKTLEWDPGRMEVIALPQNELREIGLALEANTRAQSLRVLRLLGKRGRRYVKREPDYRFAWIKGIDRYVGVHYFLCICRAENSAWLLRMVRAGFPKPEVGRKSLPN